MLLFKNINFYSIKSIKNNYIAYYKIANFKKYAIIYKIIIFIIINLIKINYQ